LTFRQRLNVSRLALAFGRTTIGAWLIVGLAGFLAARQMPVAMFPDIVFPVVVVTADAPGRSADEIGRELTVPIEARLLRLAGRRPLRSLTNPGRAILTVEFEVGISLGEAQSRVQAAIADFAPPAGSRLAVRRIDLNETPVVTFALAPSDPQSFGEVAGRAGTLARELGRVEGVARVLVLGLDPLQAGEAATRVRLDGAPAVALEVIKRPEVNTLELAAALDRAVARFASSAPAVPGLRIRAVRAEAPFIREATGSTLEALLAAVVLSVLVIYPFLRSARATAISALAIPTSLLGTFLAMRLAGFQFETITLLALALVIGIIIDDAIVDVENIARHLPLAGDALLAARRATDEIGLTVTAATLTIVAVFVPVGLMGGVIGTFFRPFGLTISAAVLTSLLVARTLTPVLAARWLRVGSERPPGPLWSRVREGYRALLSWAILHPLLVLLAALASLGAGLALIPLIPQGFIPVLDRGECVVRYTLAPGSGLEAADETGARIARIVGADRDVASVLSVAGSAQGATDEGSLQVALRAARSSSTRAVQERLRAALALESRARVSVENVPIISVAAAQPLEITLTADDASLLPGAARKVLTALQRWPGVADAALSGGDGEHTLMRHEGHPAAVLRANLSGSTALGTVGGRVLREVPPILPAGVRLALEGESAQAADVFGHFAAALGLASAGVLLVLLLLFRNLRDPLAILVSLPLSGVGAMLGLFVARSDFGIVSLLGLVFLSGLASKNAILLVDRINQVRARGLGLHEAILEAGPVRLRPILMTTAEAVLGMVPIALGLGAGAELRSPMAIAIIGGLLTSTLLALVVVPVVYLLLDRLAPRGRAGKRGPGGD